MQTVGILQMKVFHDNTFWFYCSPVDTCAVPVESCPWQGQSVTIACLYGESRHVHAEFLHQSIPPQLSLEPAGCHHLAEFLEAVSGGVCSGT